MNPILKKLVDQGFMTEKEADHIEKGIERKDSFIVSGHKSASIRMLMANIMAVAKGQFKTIQVKGSGDLEREGEYLLIPGIADIDFEALIKEAMAIEDKSLITIKEPDHPYSVFKLLRENFKINGETSKTYQILECAKVEDIPRLVKITTVRLDEEGKLIKKDL